MDRELQYELYQHHWNILSFQILQTIVGAAGSALQYKRCWFHRNLLDSQVEQCYMKRFVNYPQERIVRGESKASRIRNTLKTFISNVESSVLNHARLCSSNALVSNLNQSASLLTAFTTVVASTISQMISRAAPYMLCTPFTGCRQEQYLWTRDVPKAITQIQVRRFSD